MKKWYKRWMLRRIIMALREAVEVHGLKKEVVSVATALESTLSMSQGLKKDTMLTVTITKDELALFVGYLIQLHSAKLSLLTRARIGLVALLVQDKKLMPGEVDPVSFAETQFQQAKSSEDDKRIIQLTK